MRKIAFMGVPVSSGNRGVLALGSSLVFLALKAYPGAEIKLLLGHRRPQMVSLRPEGTPDRGVCVVNYRLSPKSKVTEHLFCIVACSLIYRMVPVSGIRRWIAGRVAWIKTVSECDIVGDIRGGDSFSDIYGMRRFIEGFLAAWSIVLIKGSIVLLPQTYGPYKTPLARFLGRYILRRSLLIVARDAHSQAIAKALHGGDREVVLSPDVAFALEAVRPKQVVLHPPTDDQIQNGWIGINVNGLMFNGGYNRNNMFGLKIDYSSFVIRLVESLLKEQDNDIVLVPHTYAPADSVESDNETCRKVWNSIDPALRNRVRWVDREYDQFQIKGIIGQFDFFIGSRMHACIAALSQGVPCIGVAYSGKFVGVFESVGAGEWVIDARKICEEEAIGSVLQLYHNRSVVRETLAKRAAEARGKLDVVFARLLNVERQKPAFAGREESLV